MALVGRIWERDDLDGRLHAAGQLYVCGYTQHDEYGVGTGRRVHNCLQPAATTDVFINKSVRHTARPKLFDGRWQRRQYDAGYSIHAKQWPHSDHLFMADAQWLRHGNHLDRRSDGIWNLYVRCDTQHSQYRMGAGERINCGLVIATFIFFDNSSDSDRRSRLLRNAGWKWRKHDVGRPVQI